MKVRVTTIVDLEDDVHKDSAAQAIDSGLWKIRVDWVRSWHTESVVVVEED
jgi:hypothetical protein